MHQHHVADIEQDSLTLSFMGSPVKVVRDQLVQRGCFRFMGLSTHCPIWRPKESRGPFVDLQDAIDAAMADGHVFRRVHMHPADVDALVQEAEDLGEHNAADNTEESCRR